MSNGVIKTSILLLGATLLILVTTGTSSGCEVDVCFAVDDSSMLSEESYEKQLRLVRNIAAQISSRSTTSTGPNISIYKYAQSCSSDERISDPVVDLQITKNRISSPASRRRGGLMNMYSGIKCCQAALSDEGRARMLVIIAGGSPNAGPGGPDMIKHQVMELRKRVERSRVNILTIGLHAGDNQTAIDSAFLRSAASHRSYTRVISTHDVGAQFLLAGLGRQICEPRQGIPLPALENTDGTVEEKNKMRPTLPSVQRVQASCNVNICFVIDASPSMSQRDFGSYLDFVAKVVTSVSRRSSGVSFGRSFAAFVSNTSVTSPPAELTAATSNVAFFLKQLELEKKKPTQHLTDAFQGIRGCHRSLLVLQTAAKAIVLLSDSKRVVARDSEAKLDVDTIDSATKTITIGIQHSKSAPPGHSAVFDRPMDGNEYLRKVSLNDLKHNGLWVQAVTDLSCGSGSLSNVAEGTESGDKTKPDNSRENCTCSQTRPPNATGQCAHPTQDDSTLCELRYCQIKPTFECDPAGVELCSLSTTPTVQQRCTSALNRTHCSCTSEASILITPQADQTAA